MLSQLNRYRLVGPIQYSAYQWNLSGVKLFDNTWHRSICMGADQHAQLYRLFYTWLFPLVLLLLMVTATEIDTMKQIFIVFPGQLSHDSSFWYSTSFPRISLVLVSFWSFKRAFFLVSTIPWTIRGELGPGGFHPTHCASTVTSHLFLKQYQTFILVC